MEAKSNEKLPYPKAVGFIVTNEFCERFSYYGMRTILSLYLRDKLGYSDNGATVIYHVFTMFAYFFPVLGAMIADGWLGRFRTILYLSLVYASGSVLISLTAMPPVNLPQLSDMNTQPLTTLIIYCTSTMVNLVKIGYTVPEPYCVKETALPGVLSPLIFFDSVLGFTIILTLALKTADCIIWNDVFHKEFTVFALLLVAFGTGGIKPCVSAFGGDQFKLPEQERYLGYFFSLFYFAINAGSLISTFLTPILRADVHCFGENDCYSLAFGVPGILMIVSILFFVAGKRLYIIKNPAGNVIGRVATCICHAVTKSCKSKEKREHWLDHADDKFDSGLIEDIKALLRVLVLFVPLPVFWALFDQQGSRWTFQADRMYQDIGSWTLKADQMQVLNPLLILIFIPLFEVAIYPFLSWCKLVRKPLHKMIWGGILAACAFVISGIVELNLLPTYGTPVSPGLAQLRIYNGFNCNITLNTGDIHKSNDIIIGPLSVYEKLDIETESFVVLPYSMQGQANSDCSNISRNGIFHLKEEMANSFFVNYDGIYNFTDKTDKALDGVGVRFLSNINGIVPINIFDTNKNMSKLILQSSNTAQNIISKGNSDILINGETVLKGFNFQSGAVYTIIVSADSNGIYTVNPVMITPANTVHILWLIPQYVVMTMGEVMFSVTGLEFSFTQAPASMKSVLQSVWLLTVAFGNLIVVLIVEGNFLNAQWKEFFLFAGLMLIDMFIFTAMAFRYKYVQHKSSTENIPAAVEEIRLPEKQTPRRDD